jgi:tRNA(fMet)-specific endonuclease VapC
LKKYLIDTNICIFYIKGEFNLKEKFENADPNNCFISEITLAELKFGVENSEHIEKNQKSLDKFLTGVNIVSILWTYTLRKKLD